MEPIPPPEEPILNIIGEKVALGPLRRDLLPLYTKWMNDFEVTRNLLVSIGPMTRESEESWYERAAKSDNERNVTFTLYERESMRPIGNTGLHKIDAFHRAAEFGIVIGEKDCWGKGLGTETVRLVLDYGFNALGLHNIMLEVFGFNERGFRAYRRAGFKEIGRRREALRLGGRAFDVILMDCLSTEFESPVLARLLLDES